MSRIFVPFWLSLSVVLLLAAQHANGTTPFGGFRTYSQINSYLDSMTTNYSSICGSKFSIGTTSQGNTMWVIKISDQPGTDDTTETGIFYCSLIHANEPMGGAALLAYMNYLVSHYNSDTAVSNLVNTSQLFFLVVANPDGYLRNDSTNPNGGGGWRKNRRPTACGQIGVDPNRNFDYQWGLYAADSICSNNSYRGPSAFSDSESVHISQFVTNHKIHACNSIHSGAQKGRFVYPFGYSTSTSTGKDKMFQNLGWQMRLRTGDGYPRYDSSKRISNYYPTIISGCEPDWFWNGITGRHIVAIGTEVRSSSDISLDYWWPNPDSIAAMANELIQPNLFLAKIASNPYAWDFVQGDWDGDGYIDLADFSAINAYLYLGGSPPSPEPRGDFNCDGGIDFLDYNAYLDYLYDGGPAPNCK